MSASAAVTANGHTNGSPTAGRVIPLSFDAADSESSARALVLALNSEWETSPGDVEFVRFKDGITNTLYKAIKKRPGHSEAELDYEAILLRAYGNGTDVLIDREREAISHSLLAARGLAPPLLARFNNGLLYSFIRGDPCSAEDLRRPDVWPATAKRLGQWHAVLPIAEAIAVGLESDRQWTDINKMLPGLPTPNIWTTLQKWIAALPKSTPTERERNAVLQNELESVTRELGRPAGLDHGGYVMDHCDLLSGNVIVIPTKEKAKESDVRFIDYEYTTPGPAAFDLANHFAEWAGFECEYGAIPTRSQRRGFIDAYVSSYRMHQKEAAQKQNGTINGHSHQDHDADVDQLMREVDLYRGMPGLFWGIWALIQAMISAIDFDYPSYAEARLGEYWAWKAERDGSRAASGKPLSLREQRWAQE